LVASLSDASDGVADLTGPHREATSLVAGAAAPTTPRRSGVLAAGTRTDASPTVGNVYNSTPYAVPVHWGAPSRNIRARPWLIDTLTKVQGKAVAVYEKHVETTLDDIKGK
jgi:hypothetical protein